MLQMFAASAAVLMSAAVQSPSQIPGQRQIPRRMLRSC